ncbi:MAG TPA: hypothetical protein VJG32_08885 [Anaerolineae bacterium]|nr:hypothetical protein [Anaerolineae bacterium]
MHILLIEDNPDHVYFARRAIEETWGDATLDVARDLREVEALMQRSAPQTHFDLLLAALDSRDNQRLMQLRELQTCPEMQTAPIIALVSSTRDQELAQVANQPLDWIILKPLRAEALQEAIQRRPLA